jgi:outer membrane biosynthesis protein TonB
MTTPAGRSNAPAGSFSEGTTMTKIALVSLQRHVYAGRRFKPGDEFEARGQSDARLLIALKRADFAPAMQEPEPQPAAATVAAVELPIAAPVAIEPAPPPDAATDAPSAETAEPTPTPADDQPAEQPTQAPAETAPAEPVKPRRTYRRRDMTAEGSEG